MSTCQHFKTTFKYNLTCMFLSLRAKLKRTLCPRTPCSKQKNVIACLSGDLTQLFFFHALIGKKPICISVSQVIEFKVYLTTIAGPWYFWKGIRTSKAHKPVTLSGNATFTKV